MRRRALFALGTLIIAASGLVACAPKETVDPAAEQAAADLVQLKEKKPLLDEKRQELQQVRDHIAGKLPEGEAADGEGAQEGEPPTPEELEGRATAIEEEIGNLSEEIGALVVSFLNNSNITIGADLTPDQQYAVDIKIDEDIAVAQEYIDKGGDYARALEIYQQSMSLDPDSAKLQAVIATAEEMRWMTEERFNQIKKKMPQDEVRELLGQVMRNNVKEYPDRGVVAWFYKKEDGGAAGVFFKEKKKGQENWTVYDLDYNAIKQQVIEGES